MPTLTWLNKVKPMKITDLIDPLRVNQNLVNHEKQDMGGMYLLTHKLNSSAYAIRLLIYTGRSMNGLISAT